MPQGVIGHGIPTGRQSGYPSAQHTGHYQVKFGTTNFQEITDGKYTLGEVLDKAEWDKLLPSEQIFSKSLKEHLYNSNFLYYTILNIIQGLTSLLFLAAVIGLFSRFIRFVSDDKLNASEDNFESARTFTDILGYFLAPFILTISSAIINQIVLSITRKGARDSYKFIMAAYNKLRDSFIPTHNVTMAFFATTEIIHELELMPMDVNYPLRMDGIRDKLKSISKKIDLKYNLCSRAEFRQMHPTHLIEKLNQILLESEFHFLMKRIRYSIKKNVLKLTGQDYHTPFSVVDEYCDSIDDNPQVQRIILSIIGRISSKKVNPIPSILLNTLPLIEESTEHIGMIPKLKKNLYTRMM
jgi:hypothetical protein